MSESGESARRRGASLHRMPSPESTALPPRRVCEQARLSRDPRFDGLFFIAVTSTRIYCRPVCPAHPPKPSNITYYRTAAAAETAGVPPPPRPPPGDRESVVVGKGVGGRLEPGWVRNLT